MNIIESFEKITTLYPLFTSFIKFGILATIGEVIAYKIKTKKWPNSQFGIIPKAIVWGFLGIFIFYAFKIFAYGIPNLTGKILPVFNSPIIDKVLTAFYISFFMNIIFAPVMMIIHKITDIKIEENKGKFFSIFKTPHIDKTLSLIKWEKMWGFVIKKTIPIFWIPAHTITFLLPSNYRILFAAVLSVILGIILALSDNK